MSLEAHKNNQYNAPEQKLPIKVRNIDSIQIYDINAAESAQRQILQQLATQTTSTDDENLAVRITSVIF